MLTFSILQWLNNINRPKKSEIVCHFLKGFFFSPMFFFNVDKESHVLDFQIFFHEKDSKQFIFTFPAIQ